MDLLSTINGIDVLLLLVGAVGWFLYVSERSSR